MFREQARKRLTKKAKKGFRGYPVATVAFYGPDDRRASKLAVGIVLAENEEADVKKPKRRAARLVSSADIVRIAFEDDLGGTLIEPALKGHLALEALVVEFLEFG